MDKINIKRNLPLNFNPEDYDYFGHELSLDIREASVYELKNIYIDHKGYFISFPGVSKYSYLLGNPIIYTKYIYFLKSFLFRDRQFRFETSPLVWITDNMSSNFFHWFGDTLPKLMRILEANDLTDVKVILSPRLFEQSFIRDSLKMIDIQYVLLDQNTLLKARRLYVSENLAPSGNYNPAMMQLLRQKFQGEIAKLSFSQEGEKVYISRKLADKRKIVNEAQVEALLQKYGFKTYYFENLSFAQQAFICSKAKYLVSLHGAGLTNMLFMNSGSRVFEFRHFNDKICNCYFSLTSALDISYFYQICECVNGTDPHDADIKVNIAAFEKNLDQFTLK